MRTVLKILTGGALVAALTVSAQTESVEGILKELGAVTAPRPAAPAMETAEITPVPTQAEVVAAPVASDEIPAAVIEALDVDATLAASQELYVGGEFEQAQRGFEAVIKKDPENIVARMYLRRILERDFRKVEVQGMKAVRGAWDTSLVLRSYEISSDAAEKMGLQEVTDSADVASRFPEVDFPKGSSAVYQPRLGRMFVRNTLDNLLVMEEILDAMDVAKISSGVEQVEIEAKFVEVAEGTLEALGFNWNFDNSVNTGIEGNDILFNDGPNGLFANALRGTEASPALPFARSGTIGAGVGMGIDPAGAGDWRAFRFEDTFSTQGAPLVLRNEGSNPLDLLIRALDQSTGTDVLSAPRIVTRSGKKATIRVGQLHYFPEVYEVGGNEGNILHVRYQDFAEKLLGVELDVSPRVDGDQITLALNPKISELAGWQNYQIAPSNSAYGYYQFRATRHYNHDEIIARLPIFKRREVKTEVTIADGSTMGMGGLINERIEKFNDRVPFLGSLPLVGRLFRSEGERAVKRNLMIFVTARKVEPSGRINTSRSFE